MRDERLVVVGASLAGLRAVEAARKSGFDGPITLIGNEPHLPYDRPPLSKAFLDAESDVDGKPEVPTFRDEATLRDEMAVDLRLGAPATALVPADRVVLRGDDAVPYDRLIIATGGDARMLPGGDKLQGVHVLRTLDDAIAVRAALDAGARTVVVGAGFIGSEVASAARKRGLSCTVLEALPVPLVRSVGVDTGKVAAELHRLHGTDLRCGVGVTALEGSGHVEKVILDDGTVIEADLVVVGIGVRPATGWLESSGIALHERDGGILCDEYLRTSLPGVYAAGDIVHFPNPLFDGEMMRVEQWTNAAEQGALAAKNALFPDDAKPSAAVPYFWSDWYDSRIQFVGIPQSEEVRVVSAELGEEKFLALYRRGDKLGGALTVNRQAQIMKYKRMIAQGASWSEALTFAGVPA